MKIVLKRTAIAADPNQSGKKNSSELRELNTLKYSSKWVQVNDSLKSEAILYPYRVYLGCTGVGF